MVAKGSAASTPAAADKSTKKAAATKKTSAAGKTAAKKTAKKTAKAAEKKQGSPAVKGEAPEKKTAAKKASAKKAAAPKRAAKKTTAKKQTTGAEKVAAKKTPVAKTEKVPTARAVAARPGELAVRAGEEPWTPEEVEEARSELQSEAQRLRDELVASGEALDGLMRDSGDGAGDDDADTGTKNITREHEMSLAANAREMLYQTERAIERLDAGTYGLCENCGDPIGKARMQAFPRATLCVECKQQQERR